MSTSCESCGATLSEGQSFCTVCGKQRVAKPAQSAPSFCTGCGSSLLPGIKFCEKCGTPASGQAAATVSTAGTAAAPALKLVPKTEPVAAPSPAGNRFFKVVMILVALLAFFLIAIMGSCAYIAYRAKQKAHAIEEAYQQNDMNKVASELGIKTDGEDASRGSGSPSSSPAQNAKPDAPYGWTLQDGKLVPAKAPQAPQAPKADPVVPVAATGNQAKDWASQYERT